MFRNCQSLAILISKSFSRAGLVQILATSQLQKVFRPWQFLTILTSKSFSHAGVVQILAILNDFEFQIALVCRRGANFGNILGSRSSAPARSSELTCSYPPKPHVTHLCCITSARSHLLVDRSSAATLSIVGS